tara:strand:- start:183 stop:581 length:399 start_codon:yes stop_codon:yes gene_type:complete
MQFQATKEQEKIRNSARALYDSGHCLVGEWVKRIPSFTMQKWNTWERTSGFMEWWIEVFPEHNGVTISDLKALEFEAGKALLRSLYEGDMAATKIVIQMINSAKEAKAIGDKSMDQWFEASVVENGWDAEWN